MRSIRAAAFPLALIWILSGAAVSGEAVNGEGICAPGILRDSSGVCLEPEVHFAQTTPQDSPALEPHRGRKQNGSGPHAFVVYLFWGRGCVHCDREKRFLSGLKRDVPEMEIRDYEVWYHPENADRLSAMLKAHDMRVSGVPITFIDTRVFAGFSSRTERDIEDAVRECRVRQCAEPGASLEQKKAGQTEGYAPVSGPTGTIVYNQGEGASVDLPLFGRLDARNTSLPVMTILIAGLDSFNPCAFFVLLSLLGLLVHARSRAKILMIGGVFVFFSGLIYYLFMAAWLNLFLIIGQVALITTIAGYVSVVIGAVNIKDYFLFKKGVSLTIPDSAKPRLFDRMRRLLRAASLPSILAGTTVLAVVANSYELLCTAGFPMVFTRILTLHTMSAMTYYLYLALYAIVYTVPLFLIVATLTITLGNRKLSEQQGRVLKLVSGFMMFGLGVVLIVNPALLNSLLMSVLLLAGSLAVSAIITLARGQRA